MKDTYTMALAAALLATAPSALFAQDEPNAAPSPNEIVDSAAPDEWTAIVPEDLLVMNLAPDRDGNVRRVIIELMPPPFSQGWVSNIRKLAAAHWWDGTSINRVQDNYVVQWGDASEAKPLPEGLAVVPESEYVVSEPKDGKSRPLEAIERGRSVQETLFSRGETHRGGVRTTVQPYNPVPSPDPYTYMPGYYSGWPIGHQRQENWPVHCYGMVGVGRNLSPDTGTGAELYTVIGHAPRHLDRNIALVGRVIEGIEHLSSLPRGKGDLGFYKDESKRVPITSVRLGNELPDAEQPKFEYLSTDGQTFARYADARANRRDPFFIVPAGGADICNIPVPVRRVRTN